MSGDRGDTGLRYDIASAKVVRGQKTILGPCGSNKGQPLNVKLFEPKKKKDVYPKGLQCGGR